MKIAVFANTPAQVHLYKNIVKRLEERGHDLRLLLRDYGEAREVASELNLSYTIYSKPKVSKMGKILSLPRDIIVACRKLQNFKPDIITGMGVYDAFTSALLRAKSVVFNDSEPISNKVFYSTQFKFYLHFVDAIVTPSSFREDLGKKHIRVNSYKELAYLHPNYYKPDESIKEILGLEDDEEYVLLRFNAFDAVHDFGISGFSIDDKIRLVNELEKHAKVFISSESKLPEKLEKYRLPAPKSRIHDVIYYAKLLVTDTQTMTTEAGILGTPSIRCNKFVGKNDMGNFIELEKKYGLIYNYRDPEMATKKALELVKENNLKKEWREKREKLLKDKIDLTAFMVWFIENFPESFREFKENPEIQWRFK
jgi:predicted glycosyltransferase